MDENKNALLKNLLDKIDRFSKNDQKRRAFFKNALDDLRAVERPVASQSGKTGLAFGLVCATIVAGVGVTVLRRARESPAEIEATNGNYWQNKVKTPSENKLRSL